MVQREKKEDHPIEKREKSETTIEARPSNGYSRKGREPTNHLSPLP